MMEYKPILPVAVFAQREMRELTNEGVPERARTRDRRRQPAL